MRRDSMIDGDSYRAYDFRRPDAPVGLACVDGHELVEYDADKHWRMMRILSDYDPGTVVLSPDLYHMLARGRLTPAQAGWRVLCGGDLPEDTVAIRE
jgi:hypothetical protein